jgi:uncharacterized membrane protein
MKKHKALRKQGFVLIMTTENLSDCCHNQKAIILMIRRAKIVGQFLLLILLAIIISAIAYWYEARLPLSFIH